MPTTLVARRDSSDTPHEGEVVRYDVGRLGNVTRTPQGGLRVPAYLTRSGVFSYVRADGSTVREYRPPEEVFHRDSLQTLLDAPVTDLHPTDPQMVTPQNFQRLACGHTKEPRQDGERIAAELVIQAAGLVGKVQRRDATEVSCGYVCRVDFTPGTTPAGEAYDVVQRGIRYNHVAIVPHGRAGSDVSLRLDSAGNVRAPGAHSGEQPREQIKMENIRIDGVDYPLGTEAERKAAAQAMARYQTKLDSEAAAVDALRARVDAAEASVQELKTKLATAEDPARLDALVEAKTALRTVAARHVEVKADASDADIRAAVITKAFPSVRLDGKSADYCAAMYDAAVTHLDATKTVDPDGLGKLRTAANSPAPAGRQDAKTPSEEARERMDATNRQAWTRPLAFSKDSPPA